MILGIHYNEGYAPMPSPEAIQLVLLLSLFELKRRGINKIEDAEDNWIVVEAFKVEAAFLNAKLEGKVYIHLPAHFEAYCKHKDGTSTSLTSACYCTTHSMAWLMQQGSGCRCLSRS